MSPHRFARLADATDHAHHSTNHFSGTGNIRTPSPHYKPPTINTTIYKHTSGPTPWTHKARVKPRDLTPQPTASISGTQKKPPLNPTPEPGAIRITSVSPPTSPTQSGDSSPETSPPDRWWLRAAPHQTRRSPYTCTPFLAPIQLFNTVLQELRDHPPGSTPENRH